jgi:5-methylcytosine-specific restriction endonuclease McrA
MRAIKRGDVVIGGQMTQKQRRRALEKAWRQVRALVWERDAGACVLCGRNAVTVNHILSRGAHKELFLEITNLACLCRDCDFDANTETKVRQQIKVLAERYDYAYSEYYLGG